MQAFKDAYMEEEEKIQKEEKEVDEGEGNNQKVNEGNSGRMWSR